MTGTRPGARRRVFIALALGLFVVALLVASAWRAGAISAWGRARATSRDAIREGRSQLQRGQPRRALRAVARIAEGDPEEAEVLLIRGLALAALEDAAAARRTLERAWRLRPDPMAGKVLAAIYLAANETERGEAMLQTVAQMDPADFRPWYALAEMVYRRSRRYDKAIPAFQEALSRSRDHLESRIGLADCLLQIHQPGDARPFVEDLARDLPNRPEVLVLAARLASEQGDQEEAIRRLDRALGLDPGLREALVLRAQLRFRAGAPRQALPDARQALELDPNDFGALNLLASIQNSLGEKDQAAATIARRRAVEERAERIAALSREVAGNPTDALLRCRLGWAAAEAGLIPLARQSYQAALALDPRCRPARDGLLALGSGADPAGRF